MIFAALLALMELVFDSIRKLFRRTLPPEERRILRDQERKHRRRFDILILTVVILGLLVILTLSHGIAN